MFYDINFYTFSFILSQNIEDISHRLLGKSVYVNWPHMEEAKVVAVSSELVKVSGL